VDEEAAGCIPTCGVGRVAGGQLPGGRYQTQWFFGGYMTLESDGTWPLTEDSNAELSMPVQGDYRMAFSLDPMLVLHGTVDTDLPLRASSYVAWLAAHPDLAVSEPVEAHIGNIPALAVDVRLGSTIRQDNADCGADPCIAFIKNPAIPRAFEHVDGILGDDVYRFYFADIAYAGMNHLLVVKIEARDATDLQPAVERAEEILRTVVVPAHSAGASQ
jgi:hypothetical protein